MPQNVETVSVPHNRETVNSQAHALAQESAIVREPVPETTKPIIAPEDHVAPGGIQGFIGKFTVLKGARRELWLTFLIKFLIYTAYSVTNKTMVLWLSKDLGFNDQSAAAIVR